MREKRTSEVSMGYPKQEVHAICAYDFCCFLYKISCTVSEYYFFLNVYMLKKISQENNKAEESIYVCVYIHKPCVVSADDSKAQFKWGRVKRHIISSL